VTIPLEEPPYLSAEESFLNWAEKNGCAYGTAYHTYFGASWCTQFDDCSGLPLTVTLCSLQDGGHDTIYDHGDINVSLRSWNFMKAYAR
jgi:hypothetical protein